MVENLGLGQHAVGVEHQVVQQVELGGGEIDFFLAEEYLVGIHVQAQVVDAQNGIVLVLDGAAAAQDGADAGNHLIQREGLGHVVVAAGTQAGDLVFGGVLRGEEEDGDGASELAQAAGHLEAVHAGHHDVEDNQIGRLGVGLLEGVAAVTGGDDLKTGEAQGSGE